MAFIGNQPTAVPLTSSQLADGLITTDKLAASAVTSAKILDSTIVNADIASTTINLTQKVTGTLPVANGGTGLTALGTAGQALIVNSSATALSYATVGATAGQVIQVVSTAKTTPFTTTSTSLTTAFLPETNSQTKLAIDPPAIKPCSGKPQFNFIFSTAVLTRFSIFIFFTLKFHQLLRVLELHQKTYTSLFYSLKFLLVSFYQFLFYQ